MSDIIQALRYAHAAISQMPPPVGLYSFSLAPADAAWKFEADDGEGFVVAQRAVWDRVAANVPTVSSSPLAFHQGVEIIDLDRNDAERCRVMGVMADRMSAALKLAARERGR
jgi:hypothetical protein